MANRKKNKGTRAEPGFNPPKAKTDQHGYGKYVQRKDAFGERQTYNSRDIPQVQQGTLFSHRALMAQPANKALKEQRVGPRGYSKARLDEVRAGIGEDRQGGVRQILRPRQREAADWEVESGRAIQAGSSGGKEMHWTPAVNAEKHIYAPEHGISAAKRGRDVHQAWAQRGMYNLMGTLARSTVPGEHLKGLSEVSIEERHPEYAGTYHYDYKGEENPTYKVGHRIKLYANRHTDNPTDRADQEMTMLHELGHHWSHVHSGQFGGYDTPQQRGQEEAKADSYALQHYRQDPRNKPEYGAHFDPRSHTYGARGQADKFEGGYQLAPKNVYPKAEKDDLFKRTHDQAQNQPMLDMGSETPVFTQRPKDVTHERMDVPLQGGGTRGVWQKTTKAAAHFDRLPHQEAIYRHEMFRGEQRTNRREEARQRQEISQRWSVGRQFR